MVPSGSSTDAGLDSKPGDGAVAGATALYRVASATGTDRVDGADERGIDGTGADCGGGGVWDA
jgi:hypothetical protein